MIVIMPPPGYSGSGIARTQPARSGVFFDASLSGLAATSRSMNARTPWPPWCFSAIFQRLSPRATACDRPVATAGSTLAVVWTVPGSPVVTVTGVRSGASGRTIVVPTTRKSASFRVSGLAAWIFAAAEELP
jgi:hypothetical protein